ncbi:MAG: hypothetical protein GWN18_09085 [Thermoplasmata archaeon]|nr:hypothetical protein [Thermoplasmata archaeon]NIS12194.1 hypothetical protein [Thermoplasmata archaeon]NIS20110.1 hypothetical protein [Thermoplasmata archaeon]NIT77435.1 hypothetical protein [Thermoplasmata archaeon]NIU49211.1 hypothetical protein [Thermoplasmata archaeon]
MAEEEYDWGVYNFNWTLWEDAEARLKELIDEFLTANDRAGELAGTIEWTTGTKLIDWVDHMVLPADSIDEFDLQILGYEEDTEAETMYGARCYRHRGSTLFPLLLRPGNLTELALRVEDVDAFCHVHQRAAEPLGDPLGPYRWVDVIKEHDHLLTAVDRRGYSGFAIGDVYDVEDYAQVLDAFRERKREFPSDEQGMVATKELVAEQLDRLGTNRMADAWFKAEWEYWVAHNQAAHFLRSKHDHVGLGWANRDHQAYRCSRQLYTHYLEIQELLGMRRREMYHAGAQAGWGAQVMEQVDLGFVVFCDVDLEEGEEDKDFASEGLEPRDELGTIGLWVALHGESMLQAGIPPPVPPGRLRQGGPGPGIEGLPVHGPILHVPVPQAVLHCGPALEAGRAQGPVPTEQGPHRP